MDITSLYYFTEVAKDLHITRTANRLYISQQTLSNHIQRLEEYFGAPLLYRKPRLALTYAGEFVLDYARQCIKEETNLKDILSDLEHMERGVIHFGASPLRMHSLTSILPDFSARYPQVELRLTHTVSKELAPMVARGDLDFAILNHEADDPLLLSEKLINDQVYFCIADSLLEAHFGERADEVRERSREGVCLRDFADVPVCIFDNFLGKKIQRSLDEAKFTPRRYLTSSYSQITTAIGFQGLSAFFATRVMLFSQDSALHPKMNIFPLLYENKPVYLDIFLVRHRQCYLTHYSKYFLELLFRYYGDAEKALLSSDY